MRLKLILSLILPFCFSSLVAQTGDVETIKKLNQDWINSIAKRDASTLANILADDFVMISPNGTKLSKKDNLSMVASAQIEYHSIDVDSIDVRLITNDVAIVSCWLTFMFKSDGKDMSGKNCYQDIYLKRKGRWVAVSAHVTLLHND
ncbi:MAG TPA: nuclear transport factor 2 family protein [Puia sp.]|nr:nuclear transport factor 2 family protein [Puia sp.]